MYRHRDLVGVSGWDNLDLRKMHPGTLTQDGCLVLWGFLFHRRHRKEARYHAPSIQRMDAVVIRHFVARMHCSNELVENRPFKHAFYNMVASGERYQEILGKAQRDASNNIDEIALECQANQYVRAGLGFA